ncbi:unnamed protein product [Kuraishia capsulata CBS 1993]|uniref:Mid2 domain-containing protein n=1 Tax=Kuraishia capsulata CBS 1993 TaxID=1382522 RepID=W6MXG3_9ASCO|nr:uncharacterized protein KUCA_T00004825001 [Kuraishia capsulata CBS 1993]CDK28840.1 unnamed protein product [Kuraishia capsulata CBS 1993]
MSNNTTGSTSLSGGTSTFEYGPSSSYESSSIFDSTSAWSEYPSIGISSGWNGYSSVLSHQTSLKSSPYYPTEHRTTDGYIRSSSERSTKHATKHATELSPLSTSSKRSKKHSSSTRTKSSSESLESSQIPEQSSAFASSISTSSAALTSSSNPQNSVSQTASIAQQTASPATTYTRLQPYIITAASTTFSTTLTSVATGTQESTSVITTDLAYFNQHILTHTQTQSSGLSRGAIAGIAIGSILGSALALFVVFLFCRRKRRRGGDAETRFFSGFGKSKPERPRSGPPVFKASEKYAFYPRTPVTETQPISGTTVPAYSSTRVQEDPLGLFDLRDGLLHNQEVALADSTTEGSSSVPIYESPAPPTERLMDVLYEQDETPEPHPVFSPTYKSKRFDRYNVGIPIPFVSGADTFAKKKPPPPPPRARRAGVATESPSEFVVQDTLSSMQYRPPRSSESSSLSGYSFSDEEDDESWN